MNAPKVQSGYTACACRDCFEIAISSDVTRPELCYGCADEGCDAAGASECNAPTAYGCDGDDTAESDS